MEGRTGQPVLRFLGGLIATVGFLCWVGLGWRAVVNLDAATPQGEEGGRLMVQALVGTVLMIAGMIVLHFAADASEREESDERRPPR